MSAPALALLGLLVAVVAAVLVAATVAVAAGDAEELGHVLPVRFIWRRR